MMATQGRRRAYGQHFLRDQKICEAIAEVSCELARKSKTPHLVEIGPGKGAITLPIYRRLQESGESPSLTLIEKDQRLVEYWQSKRDHELPEPKFPFSIVSQDFLEVPETDWLKGATGIVSNLPYSAGTAIFQLLACHPEKIPFMVLMFQAEVAQRLRAKTNSKAWGSLSVWTQNRWDVETFLKVPPGAFSPPPQVDSEVIVLKPRAEPWIPVALDEEALWNGLLRAAFQHRRKMLRSGLPPDGHWRNALADSGVDGTKRAEALEWGEWRELWKALRKRHQKT